MIMRAPDVEIVELDPQTATDAEWAALAALETILLAERMPGDPPRTADQWRIRWQNVPAFVALYAWGAWTAGRGTMSGLATIVLFREEENAHLAILTLEVLPEWRRRGVGRSLLAAAAARVGAEGRRLFIADSAGNIPVGARFLQHIGARPALQGHASQLDLAEVDPALLDRWQAAAAVRAPGYALGWWDGAYPDDELPAIAELREAGNLQPMDDLEVGESRWTPERLRQLDAARRGRGEESWTLYARAPETGVLAGFTEVLWDPARPALLAQGFTAVWPAHRGRGLGRWLKAAMLARVVRDRPEVRYVRTDNADSNAPMLAINQALGFRPYAADTAWQVSLEQVQRYLAGG